MSPTTAEMMQALSAWLTSQAPGLVPSHLTIHFHNHAVPYQLPLTLGLPSAPINTPAIPATAVVTEFEPTDFQAMIYDALEGHAFHGEALAAKIGCNPRTLYKKNGLKELRAAGWIALDERGYFRPDAPPPGIGR